MGTIARLDPTRVRGALAARSFRQERALMEPAAASDDLVRRIIDGEPGADAELVERYGEGMTFLIRRWTRDRDAADDLFQETFRLALEKIRRGEVRETERLPGFLRGLARNLSIDYYRRESRRVARETPVDSLPDLSDDEPGQLGSLLRQEKCQLLRQVLGELPMERDRQILLRFYLQEEDKESIRADLGLSGSDFNVVLFRARQRYRRLVEQALARWRRA
jgi:RNA polymerase sigma-70 factor (ECF subfamily)